MSTSRRRRPAADGAPAGDRGGRANGAAIRPDIIAAATRLFSERGYHGATMRDIADALGMQKPSLYHHVREKEDLLFAIHQDMIEELISETLPIVSGSMSPADKVRGIIRVGMEFIERHKDGVAVFLQERQIIHTERWDVIVGKRDMYERMVNSVIAEGIRTGDFAETRPEIAARGILGMVNWCYTWLRAEGELTASQIGTLFADMLLSGLERRASS